MKPKLSGLPETLLVPLWARARETQRPDAIIKDVPAVEILKAIEYDFSKFDRAWMSQLGVTVRTELLDRAVGNFIRQYPEGTIVNLGAGLDTRFTRLDNGRIRWYDLDLPEVTELRRHFFQESERYRFISGSIFDFAWADELNVSDQPILFIAEGLLMYFEENEVRRLFNQIADHFPGAQMLFEMLGPALVGKGRFHDTISKVGGAEFRWSMKNSGDFAKWNAKIEVIEECYFTDYYPERWGWFGWVTRVQLFKRWLANRIVHVRFNK